MSIYKCLYGNNPCSIKDREKFSTDRLWEICLLCSENPLSWYDKHIEEPIRLLVKLLRNNGINTTCSCGHEMYVECETYGNYYDEASGVNELLTKNGYNHFKVEVIRGIDAVGVKYSCLTIWLPKPNGKLSEFSIHKGSK